MNDDKAPTKKFSPNKIVIALLMFLGLGFVINSVIGYNQRVETIQIKQERVVSSDMILEQNTVMAEQMKILLEKVTNLENKIDNLEKTGKINR